MTPVRESPLKGPTSRLPALLLARSEGLEPPTFSVLLGITPC
jgi:hypothetical protein